MGTLNVRSRDRVQVAFESTGTGPALIVVDSLGRFRACPSFPNLAELLAPEFTVITYDRRGRGASGYRRGSGIGSEVDDLAALIAGPAQGEAYLFGSASGGLLALHAAAARLPIPRLVVCDPPVLHWTWDPVVLAAFAEVNAKAGRRRRHRARALEHLLASDNADPGRVRASADWDHLMSVGRTYALDCALRTATDSALLRRVLIPTLVLAPTPSEDPTAALTEEALPMGVRRTVESSAAGVPEEILAAHIREFLLS